jgi:HAE1 family hydrophobic/amphiphilic exporter-1
MRAAGAHLLGCIYAGTFGLFRNKPTGFIPTEDEGRLIFPSNCRRPQAVTVRRSAATDERNAADHGRREQYFGYCRLNVINFSIKSNSGTFFVQLKPWDERKDKAKQLEGIMGNAAR